MAKQYNQLDRTQERYDEERERYGHPRRRDDFETLRRYGGRPRSSEPEAYGPDYGFSRQRGEAGAEEAESMAGQRSPLGPYAGRGPRHYRRTDERIAEEICDRLMLDTQIDPSEIEIEVAAGEVSLTGTVEDRRAKRRAERLAETVVGVRDVHNRLRIEARESENAGEYTYPGRAPDQSKSTYMADQATGYDPRLDVYQEPENFSEYRPDPTGPYRGRGPKGYQRSSERLAEEINDRLTQHGRVNAENIEVEVNATQVTLKGSVGSPEERRIADDIALSLSGVTQVI
nr:BON domain-containing protein [Anaerolineae bacterium]